MKINQLYTDNELRNFTYIIEFTDNTAMVVDPWSDTQVNQFLSEKHLKLKAIINTHEHWDHTKGNEKLVEQHGCEVWAHRIGIGKIPALSRLLNPGEKIQLADKTTLEIIDTPGHCQAHLCFIVYQKNKAQAIFTGDILFNAGVGNCHNGDVEDLYHTITTKIATLSDNIKVYPGHDYLQNNIGFTLDREPSNQMAKEWLHKYQQADLFKSPLTTTIADEKQINTFLRLSSSEIRNNLSTTLESNKQVFIALRSLRDKW